MSDTVYLHKYRMPCTTCGNVLTNWVDEVPTECPNDPEHEIDDANIVIIDTIEATPSFTHYFSVSNPTTNVGEFPVDDSETVRISFQIPCCFVALSSLVVLGIPDSTDEEADIDLYSTYGDPSEGESYNQHSESDTASTYNITENKLTPIDISGVFSNIASKDTCGLRIVSNGGIKFRPYAVCICYYKSTLVEPD